MCGVTCFFHLPAFQVHARHRLLAAKADEVEARMILTNLGFNGLMLRSNGDNIIKFKYKSYDENRLNHLMGEPAGDIKAANIRYPYGVNGLLAVWPGKSEVLLRNRNKVGKDNIELPQALKDLPQIPHAPAPVPVEPRTGTQNDDNAVPVTHIPQNLQQLYVRAQTTPKFRIKFMQDLWIYLNHAKFAGKLRQPNLELIKGSTAAKMRVRGYWQPSTWTLKMHPQIFNASQDFFVEIFLHEMCHEAVSQYWMELTAEEKQDNNKHAGHGTAWSKWMRHVGLNPLRFDPREASVYMGEEEKSKHDALQEKWKQVGEEAEARGLKLLARPQVGAPVVIRRTDGLHHGFLMMQTKKSTNEWAVLPKEMYDNFEPGKAVNWFLQPPHTLYEDTGKHSMSMDHKFIDISTRVARHYQAKKDDAAIKRLVNKRLKERGDDY